MSLATYGVLGASFLWPWNALLTASSLARQKLENDAPSLYANFSSTVMTTSSVVNLLSNLYLAGRPRNYRWRVVYGELFVGVSFLVLAIMSDLINLPALWMAVVVLTTVVSSVGCALIQNGALAITQHIPDPAYALNMLNGQAIAGVLPAALPMMLSLSSRNNSSTLTLALWTFLSVCGLSVLSLVLFTRRDNRRFVEIAEHPETEDASFDLDPAAIAANTSSAGFTDVDSAIYPTESATSAYPASREAAPREATIHPERSTAGSTGPSSLLEANASALNASIEVLQRIKSPCIAILAGFAISLTYPVFANSVVSRHMALEFSSPIAHLVWNNGDLVGRVMSSYSPKLRVSNTNTLVAYAASRLVLVAVLVVNSWLNNPSDLFYFLVMFVFGITNGNLISSAISRAPQLVPPHLQPAAGGLLGLVISVGLLLGSGFSFVVVYLI